MREVVKLQPIIEFLDSREVHMLEYAPPCDLHNDKNTPELYYEAEISKHTVRTIKEKVLTEENNSFVITELINKGYEYVEKDYDNNKSIYLKTIHFYIADPFISKYIEEALPENSFRENKEIVNDTKVKEIKKCIIKINTWPWWKKIINVFNIIKQIKEIIK